jgi:hypothetical protein
VATVRDSSTLAEEHAAVAATADVRSEGASEQEAADTAPIAPETTIVGPALPSWLLSLVVHLTVVLLLALWYLPLPARPPISLVAHIEELEALEPEVIDVDVPAEELDLDAPLAQALAAENAPVAEPIDMSALAELPLEAPPLETLSLALDAGMLEPIGPAADFTAGGFGGRDAAMRGRLVRRGGGNSQSEKAVEEALDWLARHQHPDGFWSFDHRYGECQGQCDQHGTLADGVKGATGMALLPFLGAGNTHRGGRHERVVNRGIAALVSMIQLTPEGGSLYDGGQMYSQGIAAMALCEAYAMTEDKKLRGPAQAALAYICNAQDPKGGGWRYKPRQPGDTSVMGWQIGALKSGYLAGLDVPMVVPQRAEFFLNSVSLDQGQRYAYELKEMKYRPATTAIGLLCRMYLGAQPDNPVLQRGVEWLAAAGPSEKDAYFNYYATQVVFQYTSGKGKLWDKWNKAMRDMLTKTRAAEGHAAGSWAPQSGDHGKDKGGRLYATALNCMTLEVYYRLMPIYQSEAFEQGFEE